MESWWSPPPPPSSAVPSTSSGDLTSLQNVSPSIIIIILILSVTIIVSVTICLLLRFLRRRRRLSRSDSRRVSPETDGVSGSANASSSAVIDSLPLFTFSSVTRRQSSSASGDCSVCLSKFEADDRLRLLPLCCHAFHAECIDIWLQSNQTCPLCRSPIHASESDVMKVLLESSAANPGGDSFRLEIGSVSRRHQPEPDPSHQRRSSFSIGSFEYVVEHESEVVRSQTHHRHNLSDKDDAGADPTPDPALLADVGSAGGRSWLKEYMDRLSASISSRSLSFRSSGRFFTGSSRRTEFQATSEYDLESTNRIGEEISEMFRWFSGV